MKFSFAQGFERLLAVNIISSAVPNHHGSPAIVSFRNDSLKSFVFDRVIFDFDGEMFLALLPGKTFWNRPGFENALQLQSKIVMQSAGVVFLNHEPASAADLFRQRLAPFRLGRF